MEEKGEGDGWMRASAGKIDKVVDFENGRVDVEISLEI